MNRKEAVIAMLDGCKISNRTSPDNFMVFDATTGFKFHNKCLDTIEPIINGLGEPGGYELYKSRSRTMEINGKKYLQSDIDKLTPVGE